MFNQADTEFSLPSAKEMQGITLQSVIDANPLKPSMVEGLNMPSLVFKELEAEWKAFKGPVKDPQKFRMEMELHESREGFVILSVLYAKGKISIEVAVLTVDEDEKEIEEVLECCEGTPKPVETDDIKFLEGVWQKAMEPVTTLKAEKKARPNDPCPCGAMNSNGRPKKFKKCHGS